MSGEGKNVIRINFYDKKILLILSKRYSSDATQTVPNLFWFFKVTFQLSFFLYRYTQNYNMNSFKAWTNINNIKINQFWL